MANSAINQKMMNNVTKWTVAILAAGAVLTSGAAALGLTSGTADSSSVAACDPNTWPLGCGFTAVAMDPNTWPVPPADDPDNTWPSA